MLNYFFKVSGRHLKKKQKKKRTSWLNFCFLNQLEGLEILKTLFNIVEEQLKKLLNSDVCAV